MWNWLKKLWAKQETVEDVYEKRGIDTSWAGQTMAGTQGIALPPRSRSERRRVPRTVYVNPAPPPSTDDNLLTGIIIGEMLSSNNSPSEQPAPEPAPDTGFQGFGGGESGGGGASGSWDAPASDPSPSCDTSSSSDSSSSCDSSSSFDSGSSDSGSSGSSDF